ncbi:MAG: M56 family metallopeptidase [Patescibacteria group bacterium]
MGILNKKTNLILGQLAIISLLLSGLLGLAVFKFYKYFIFIIKSLLKGAQTVCGCQVPVSFTNHPYIITGLFILAIGLLTAILSFIIKSVRIYLKTTGFIKKYTARQSFTSAKLNHITQQISLGGKVIEIQTEEPMVFCYGFFNPRVCISSAVINSLSSPELKAVLLHEQHHLKVYEPIKLLLVKIISNALFFMPGIKNLSRQYAIFSELAADETATDNFKNKVPLARALNKILAQKENKLIQKGLAVSFFSQIIEERVNKLVDNNYVPRVKSDLIKILTGMLGVAIIFITVQTLRPSFFPAEQKTGNCALTEQNKLPANVWITNALTNKSAPTILCSRHTN